MSREIVDRAWQMGARLHHPDYQPRADLYGSSYFQSTSTPPYRPGSLWTPPPLNRSSQGQPNRRPRGHLAGNLGRGGLGSHAQQGPRSYEREPGAPSFPNGNSRWQPGKPHRSRGAPPPQRRRYGSAYGADIESFKGGGKHNGVYEYDAPYPSSAQRHPSTSMNGFRSASGNARTSREFRESRERGKTEKEKKSRSRQRDKAFWEEISRETDDLLGRVSLNGHQPEPSASGSAEYAASPPPVESVFPDSSQADHLPAPETLDRPGASSAPEQQQQED
ncbi:hypothetical protein [Thermogemmatispora sp.]|uniref:hypothetical protein n=1 Tax=Thermogemmatispora sp. TaxID=1968838 RepID=UPI002ACBE5DE|nr:hypothetical protein [Thermogemmatispora sp.]